MADLTLIIGNKNLSSWSMRPYVGLKAYDVPFSEKMIALDEPETRRQIKQVSPSGLVPCLLDDGFAIWDSLAILEHVAEHYAPKLLPGDKKARARCRSISAQMHSGFSALRTVWPMEIAKEGLSVAQGPGVKQDVERVADLWEETLSQFGDGGPYLFGADFSIADAMFAPVVSRFRTYGPVALPDRAAAYMEAMWAHPGVADWVAGAHKEVA